MAILSIFHSWLTLRMIMDSVLLISTERTRSMTTGDMALKKVNFDGSAPKKPPGSKVELNLA